MIAACCLLCAVFCCVLFAELVLVVYGLLFDACWSMGVVCDLLLVVCVCWLLSVV